jgi:sigma-B regulation protein RsbQ
MPVVPVVVVSESGGQPLDEPAPDASGTRVAVLTTTDVLRRNNVAVHGTPGSRPIVFAHGFGCDQRMWRWVEPRFRNEFRTVLFDHVGAGGSDLDAYDWTRYDSLHGYAEDVVQICEELDLRDAVFVGHSVGAMIGVLAAPLAAGRISGLVLVGPSPRFVDDPATGYHGGFSRNDIDELLEAMSTNYLGWSATMAPLIMGAPEQPALAEELATSFCSTDPAIAEHFATVAFLSDTRRELAEVDVPTLVLQCSEDALVPDSVGRHVHRSIPGSTFVRLDAVGHCPHLSAPDETAAAISRFLSAS